MKLPKEMEGRKVSLLMSGIAVQEVKITSITDEEITGVFSDGEEVHIATEHLRAWWPNRRKPRAARRERNEKTTDALQD